MSRLLDPAGACSIPRARLRGRCPTATIVGSVALERALDVVLGAVVIVVAVTTGVAPRARSGGGFPPSRRRLSASWAEGSLWPPSLLGAASTDWRPPAAPDRPGPALLGRP